MRHVRQTIALGFVLLLASGAVACSKGKEDGKGAPKIEPLPKEEVTRAQQACDAYVKRVCSCAEMHADMADACQLAKASPSALQINLDLLESDGLEIAEQKAVKVEARKIAAACFANESKLDASKCPRP